MDAGSNRLRASRAWHGALAALVLAALAVQVVLVLQGGSALETDEPAASVGTSLVRLFSYFTIQSNILVAAAAAFIARRPDRDGPLWRVLHLDTLLGITVTGLVFALVLAPELDLTGWPLAVNVVFHYVSPPAVLLGWLLFGPHGRTTARSVAWAFAWPVLWIAYTFARGAATDWYPYPFLDATAIGLPQALLNTALVLVGALALAALYARVGTRLAARVSGSRPCAPR